MRAGDCGDDDDCQKAVHLVYQYLDGALESVETVVLSEHIRGCRGCNDAVEFERAFLFRIRTACGEPLPDHLADRVRELLRRADDAAAADSPGHG